MGKFIDLTGQKFGRWTVLCRAKNIINNHTTFLCVCDCGTKRNVSGLTLRTGTSVSCGCLAKEKKHAPNFKDLSGKIFGWNEVIKEVGKDNQGSILWLCRCKCGKEHMVTSGNLNSGSSMSCGCYIAYLAKERNITHGMTNTQFYNIYNAMNGRCKNKKNKSYSYYGMRGIKVCDEWSKSFKNFYNDMYALYKEHLNKYGKKNTTIERNDVNGNYCKKNCSFATRSQQNLNTRANRLLSVGKETKTMKEWSNISGINYTTISTRLIRGWSNESAIFKGLLRNKKNKKIS